MDSCDNLILDGYNLIHRSRFEWGGKLAMDDNQIIYNFMRSIKPIIERFSPKKIFFILDGAPKARIQMDETYKANRYKEDLTEEEKNYWKSFHKQKREIIRIAKEALPFVTVYHTDYECDDILAYIAQTLSGNNVIVSSDTDFIQALDISDKIRLWNPVSQEFRERLEVDYLKYKSLVGDKTDNIPGVKGIGKVGALKILKNESLFDEKMRNPSFKEQYEHSYNLVKFADISAVKSELQYFYGTFSSELMEDELSKLGFESMLKENYFAKFCKVMESVA
jgi:DNA polymerase-1